MYIPQKKKLKKKLNGKNFLLITKSFSDPALGHMPH